jgi:circadian clock protein KaiC
MYVFDESRESLLLRSRGLGIALQRHVDAGTVSIQQVDPAELTPGQFAHTLRRDVEQDGVGVVVIDSINGYANAMLEERHLAVHLHEVLTYMGQQGVATLLVGVHAGFIGGPATSVGDASYLADTIVLLRYFEAEGEVRQAISILKKRSGAHERTIREFRLADGQIRVGAPLRQFHGVLTGVPEYEGTPGPLLDDPA